MAGVPQINKVVIDAMGSVAEAIELLQSDDSPDSQAIIEKWDSLSPSSQEVVRVEELAIAAGLTPRRFMELLAGASYDHSVIVSKLYVATSRLKVLKATVKAATDEVPITATKINDEGKMISEVIGYSNGDVKAMEIFHKMTGDLPTPKPSIFAPQLNVNAPVVAAEPVEGHVPLQSMDSWLLEIDDIRKPKQLSAPPEIPVQIPVNAPEIEYLSVEDN